MTPCGIKTIPQLYLMAALLKKTRSVDPTTLILLVMNAVMSMKK